MSDWDSVTTVRKHRVPDRPTVVRDKKLLNAAHRSGADIQTEKKFGGANSTNRGIENQHLTKVDRSNEIIKPKVVGILVGKAIEQARLKLDHPLTQTQLAIKISETPSVIALYERGLAAPNQRILAKLERLLQVHLRGENIGLPKGNKQRKNV